MSEKRTKRWRKLWIAGAILVFVFGSCAIALLGRHKSKYEYLYALNPRVGEFVPSLTAPIVFSTSGSLSSVRLIYANGSTIIASGSSAKPTPKKQTVLVFRPEQEDLVEKLVTDHVPSKMLMSWRTSAGFGSSITSYVDGNGSISIATGTQASDIAAKAHLPIRPGGCAVILDEAPDWFTSKLTAVLRFLHLS